MGGISLGGIAAGAAAGFVGDQLFNSGNASDKLFGNNIPSELKNPRVTSFNAPGLDARFLSPEDLKLTRSPEMQGSLQGVSDAFKTQATELGGLKSLVQPGFGRLTQAGINAVRDARRSTMGDLKQNLARRRVRGSSFGADDISRTGAEFAKTENELTSQAFVQELALSTELTNQQAQAAANSFMQFIQQSNIESSFATQLASGVSNVLSNNAQIIGGMANSGASRLLNVGGTALGSYAALRNPTTAASGFSSTTGSGFAGGGGPSSIQPAPGSYFG